MSGWQRIGLVLSIVWVLILPIWLVRDNNSRAEEDMEVCVKYAVMNNTGDRENARIAECGEAYSRSLTTLPRLMTEFLTAGPDRLVFWSITLVPIVALWIIGSIVIGTLRWIGRGFGKKTPAPTT
jgi:hypothetical protein